MTEIFDMIEEIKNFKPFLNIQNNLLQFRNNIRSKLWTIEILTNHINDIVHDFIISDYDDISSFFVSFIHKLYPTSSKRQKNFCYTLILSLIYYKQKYAYLNLYHDLFINHKRKNFYEFLYDCKEMIFQEQNQQSTSYAQLDQIYLNDKEWIYVLNQMLGFEREEIKKFRDDMNEIVINLKKRKANYLHLQRSQQFSMYFFLQQALIYYRQIELAEKEEKLQMLEQFRQRSSVRSEQDLESSLQHEQLLQKKKQLKKEQLIQRIKETVKTTNRYKTSCITLMAYLHEIDPIFLEIKKKIQIQKDLLNQIKQNKIQGKKYEDFVNQVQVGQLNFLERGSSLQCKNSKELLKNLLNEDVDIYKVLTQRQKEKIPAIQRLIKNLRKKIFDEQFTLFQEGQGRNMDNLKKELEKIFGKFQDLKNSDYVILNTYFNNYDSNQNQELQMDNLLDKVSAKILKIVDRALDENEQIDEESLQSISRSSQKQSKQQSQKVTFSQLDKQVQEQKSDQGVYEKFNQDSRISSQQDQQESKVSSKEEDRKISFGRSDQLQESQQIKESQQIQEDSKIQGIKEDSFKQSIQQKEIEKSKKSIKKVPVQVPETQDLLESKESEADDDYINRINKEVDVQHKKQSMKQDEEKQKQIDKIAEKRIPQFLQKKQSQFNVLDLPINNTFKEVKPESPKKQVNDPVKKDSIQNLKNTEKSESEKRDVFDIKRSQSPPKQKRQSKFHNLERTDMNDEGDKFSQDYDLSPRPNFNQTQNFDEDNNRNSKVSFNQTTDLGQLRRGDKTQQSKKSLRKSKHQQSRKSNLGNSQVSRQSIQSRSSKKSKRNYMQLYEDRKSLARNQSRASIVDSRVNMRDSISPSLSNRNDINLPVKKNPYDKPKKSLSKKSLTRTSNLPPRNSMKNNIRQSKASLADQRIQSKGSLHHDDQIKKKSSKKFNQTQGTELIDTQMGQTKRTELIDTQFDNVKKTELIDSDNDSDDRRYHNKQTEIIDTQVDQTKNDDKRNTLEIQTNNGDYVDNELIRTITENQDEQQPSVDDNNQQKEHLNYSGPKNNFLKDSERSISKKSSNKHILQSDKKLQESQKSSSSKKLQESQKSDKKHSLKQSQQNIDMKKSDQQDNVLQESSLKQIMVDSEVVEQPMENKRKESKKNSMRETGIQFKDSKFEINSDQDDSKPRNRLSTIHEDKKSKLDELLQQQSKVSNQQSKELQRSKELQQSQKLQQSKEQQGSNKNIKQSEILDQEPLDRGNTELRNNLLQSEEQIFASGSHHSKEQALKQSSIKDNQQRISQLQQSELYALTQSKQMKNLESIGKNVQFEEGYQNATDVNSLSSNRQNNNLQNSLLTNEKKFTNLENFDDFKQNLDQINSYNILANDDQTIMISNPKVSADRKQNDGNESINAIIGNLENKDDTKYDNKIEKIPEEDESQNILPDDSAMINDSLHQDLKSLGISDSQQLKDSSQKEKNKIKRNIETKKGQAIAEKVGLIDTDKKSVKNFFKNIFKQFYKFKFNEQQKKLCQKQLNIKIDISLQLQTQIIQNISQKTFTKNRNLNCQ